MAEFLGQSNQVGAAMGYIDKALNTHFVVREDYNTRGKLVL
jgi:hypothetical protein